jgi:hypothetical protein
VSSFTGPPTFLLFLFMADNFSPASTVVELQESNTVQFDSTIDDQYPGKPYPPSPGSSIISELEKAPVCPNSDTDSDDKPSDLSFIPPSRSFIVEKSPVDIRYYIHSAIVFFYLLWWAPMPRLVTILGFTVYNFFAPMVRILYPTFGRLGILDDLRINAGATLSLFASITALFLQVSPKPHSVPN